MTSKPENTSTASVYVVCVRVKENMLEEGGIWYHERAGEKEPGAFRWLWNDFLLSESLYSALFTRLKTTGGA